MKQITLFWIAVILITEPLLVLAWPRIRVGFFISNPRLCDVGDRIKSYYDRCSEKPFGTYGSFRRKARACMWCFGFAIMTMLAANSIFDLNILK